MGTSEKTFQQVKAILGKLDRSIDSLRAQRTGDAPGRDAAANTAQPASTFPNGNALVGDSSLHQTVGQPAIARAAGSTIASPSASPALGNAAFNRPASPFGRATPIRPTGS
jgi:hypothetical protein